MSIAISIATSILNNALVQLIALAAIIAFLFNRVQWIRQRFFVWIYMQFSKDYVGGLANYKKDLFAPLQNFTSLDENLRKSGSIRILEIGAGPGSNFNYFPKNSKVIVIDPNPYFKKYLEENGAKFPHVNIEKVFTCVGEDLGDIEDNSVDIVVTTIVLCSVHNVQKVLSEIQRVLAPGGKYFFIEHVIAAEGSWMRLRQKWINPIWKKIFDGCEVTRNVQEAIQRTGFVKLEFNNVFVQLPWFFRQFVAPHVYGNVQKRL